MAHDAHTQPGAWTHAANQLAAAIDHTPSLFGRLVSIAEFRNPATGRYEHHLAQNYGQELVHCTLEQLHQDIFAEWVAARLEQQEIDVRGWLAWLDRNPEEKATLLAQLHERLGAFVPRPLRLQPERFLFIEDFQLLRCLLCRSESLPRVGCNFKEIWCPDAV